MNTLVFSFEKRVKWDWFLIFILPILLYLISDRWTFFPVHNWFDPWMYLGVSLNYDFFRVIAPDCYQISRLPTVIPIFYVYKWFQPYTANVILVLLKFYLCIIPLYWTLIEITKNQFSSLLPIFLLSFFPHFLFSLGWNYVDGFGMGYICAATAFLVAANKNENWKFYVFLAGAAQALMMFNYLSTIIFAFFQLLVFITYNKNNDRKSLITCFLYLIAGAIFVTLCFCSFSYYHSGDFLFFLPQLKTAVGLTKLTYFVSGKNSIWYQPFKTWLPTSTWLFLSGITCILSSYYVFNFFQKSISFSVFKNNLDKYFDLKMLMVWQFLILFFLHIIFECLGFNFLQLFLTACYLLPFSTIALGIIFAGIIPSLKYEKILLISVFVTFVVFFSLKGNSAFINKSWSWFTVICCIASLSLMFLCFRTLKDKQKSFYLFLSLLTIALSFNKNTLPNNHYKYKNHSDYDLLVNLNKYIKNNIPSDNGYLFWYSTDQDPLGDFFQPLAATYLNCSGPPSVFSNQFPNINEESLIAKPNWTIVLLSSNLNAIEKAENALKEKGYKWKVLKKERFSLVDKSFLLIGFLLEKL